MPKIVTGLIILVVVVIAIAVVIWFCRTQCSGKENVTAGRSGHGHPMPSIHGANSNRSTSYSPFISPYPSNPPPLGFGEPVDMPQPDVVGETTHFNTNGHLDTYAPTRRAPYPLDPENNRAPYPAETSCYPPVHTAPYPVTSSMPQPFISGILNTSERNAPYPPAHTAPYPVTSSMPQPSTSRTDRNMRETFNSTRIAPYPPAHPAPYPPSNECLIPRPSLSRTQNSFDRTTGQTTYSRRSAPYPPVSSAPYPPVSSTSGSSELPPPTYEDAVNSKF